MRGEELQEGQVFMVECTFESWGVGGTETVYLVGRLNENLQLVTCPPSPAEDYTCMYTLERR